LSGLDNLFDLMEGTFRGQEASHRNGKKSVILTATYHSYYRRSGAFT
jgi:hypothetical protein